MRKEQNEFFVAGALLLVAGLIIGFAEVLHHPGGAAAVSNTSTPSTIGLKSTQFN